MAEEAREVRLAELVAVLSLGTDLGLGQPMDHVMRQCLIALGLAERLGLDEGDRRVVYYAGLLAFVGCHVDAHEQARWFSDDLATKGAARLVDFDGSRSDAAFLLAQLGAGRPALERLRLGFAFLGPGRRDVDAMFGNHCLATEDLALALGLDGAVREALHQTFERWDGRGLFGVRGDEILISARLIALADVVDVYLRSGGVAAAVRVARERSGTQFDPALVELFAASAAELAAGLDGVSTWDAVIAREPSLGRALSDPELEAALEAIADFADLKCPHTLGHSRRVADLAGSAASLSGLPAAEATLARRAALVQDLGRLGVSNAVWDKRGPLSIADWERIRLHPYLSERMLVSSPALAPLGAAAAHHHERLDGSGYPRGLAGESLPPVARLLAAADTCAALGEVRPHRPARPAAAVASVMRDEVRAGRLDGHAVEAVLQAAGHDVPRRREWPAGLTAREIEVLQLLARGHSTKEIAQRLVIARKTAGNHVQHIYAKTGVTNRAQASLFAVKHGLTAASGR